MKILKLLVMFEPTKAQFESIRLRAERAVKEGFLFTVPILTKEEASFIVKPIDIVNNKTLNGFWYIKMECIDQDYNYWIGFLEGCDMCRNNRAIMVGNDT